MSYPRRPRPACCFPAARGPRARPLVGVWASLYVERDSQKGIIIGKKGARLRKIGQDARAGIERMLGTPVCLDLRVTVARDWQRDPKHLHRLGMEEGGPRAAVYRPL